MDSLQDTFRPLLEAVAFAARAHRHQIRKDNRTPYASHVFRVCLVVRQVFGIDDPHALMAGVLHDTIEDTNTDYDDVKKEFGPEVAAWVAALSKDKRLDEEPREQAYMATLAAAPWQVKVCKLADIFDNLMDSVHLGPEQRAAQPDAVTRIPARAAAPGLPEQAREPFKIVLRLLAELEAVAASRS